MTVGVARLLFDEEKPFAHRVVDGDLLLSDVVHVQAVIRIENFRSNRLIRLDEGVRSMVEHAGNQQGFRLRNDVVRQRIGAFQNAHFHRFGQRQLSCLHGIENLLIGRIDQTSRIRLT